jgi:hypothetical protein
MNWFTVMVLRNLFKGNWKQSHLGEPASRGHRRDGGGGNTLDLSLQQKREAKTNNKETPIMIATGCLNVGW